MDERHSGDWSVRILRPDFQGSNDCPDQDEGCTWEYAGAIRASQVRGQRRQPTSRRMSRWRCS